MIGQLELFDVVVDQVGEVDDSWVVFRDGDGASCSCRWCRTATTAAGIVSRGHEGPDSVTCRRMLAWPEVDE